MVPSLSPQWLEERKRRPELVERVVVEAQEAVTDSLQAVSVLRRLIRSNASRFRQVLDTTSGAGDVDQWIDDLTSAITELRSHSEGLAELRLALFEPPEPTLYH